MARAVHENLEERLLHRMLFFTDAVFAIVMTLLVLELRPPTEADLGGELRTLKGMIGHFVAFGLSFAIIGIFWLAHLNNTRRLVRFDWATAIVNLVALFPVCSIPFASAWVGDGFDTRLAWGGYCLVLVATSTGGVALTLVESRAGGRLVGGPLSSAERWHRAARAAIPGVAFLVGLMGVLAGRLVVAQYCWLLIPVFAVLLRTVWRPDAGVRG